MSLAEDLAYTSVLVKEGLAYPPARSTMFPGVGVGSNPATQVSQQAKDRVARKQTDAKQLAQSSQGFAAPEKPVSVGGKLTVPLPPNPTVPNITGQGAAKTAAITPERMQDIRDQFEESMEREKVLRRSADRWIAASKARAAGEDTSLGGYVGTAAERMLPIPHTGTEAMIRLPLVGLGGYGGYQLGKTVEKIPESELLRAIRPAITDPRNEPELLGNLRRALGPRGQQVFANLQRFSPEDLSEALRTRHVELPNWTGRLAGKRIPIWFEAGPGAQTVRQSIQAGGAGDLATVKSEIKNVLRQTADKTLASKWRASRILGGLGGVALASGLTGLPLAARALWRKSEGGESAVRAKQQAKYISDRAEQMQRMREALLKEVEKK